MIGAPLSAGGFRRETGAVIVMVGLWLPVLVLLLSFVIDVGNWFEHKRHLQMQADAAALVAGGTFAYPGCDPANVDATAQAYGGGTYNAQIGGTSPANVHMLINSQTYYGQASPVDTTVNTADPCTAQMVDVKMTETNLPWFFKAGKLVPFINAHARVSLLQIDTQNGALPVGVPDVNPRRAAVTFVDETNGDAVLGTEDLTRTGTDAAGNALWSTSSPVPVTFQEAGNPKSMAVGVRIALSGNPGSVKCGDPLVACYDATSANGLVYIRGYSNDHPLTGQQTPIARDVHFSPAAGSCPDPYFDASSAACTVVLQAKVDFGPGDPISTYAAALNAFIPGGPNKGTPLTYDSTTGLWTSQPMTIAAAQGGLPVTLKWIEKKGTLAGTDCTKGQGCTGDLGTVQRAFSASSSASGPLQLVQVSEGLQTDTNSFEMCSGVQSNCTHNLTVQIAIQGTLKDASSVNDPLVKLRLAGSSSNNSQNQSLDCDPNLPNLKDEIANGCGPTYTKNTGSTCPANTTALWGSPQPWNCVAIQTGTAINQVSDGMNLRLMGSTNPATCTAPNHWSQFPNIPTGDPRVVPLFLVPFGTFSGSGSTVVPVIDFAYFYVTGYSGQGNGTDPCYQPGQPGSDDQADPGFIVGHFIKYIQTLDNASGSQPCDPNSFGGCVAQLTE
jgi:Flp pilus assembly protein TadG